MNKHTPGPWVESYDGWIDGADGSTVTEYAGCGSHAADYSNPADKSLIIAAPDLLEALEALAESAPSVCCVDFHHQPGDYHGADAECPALDRYEAACLAARAAIAKAGGQS